MAQLNKATLWEEISVPQAHEIYKSNKNVVVLDVRTEAEYNGPCGHIPEAILIPIDTLESRVHELEPYKDRDIVTICYTGIRSRMACEVLSKYSFKNLYTANGGMMDWYDHNFEHTEGQPTPDMPEC